MCECVDREELKQLEPKKKPGFWERNLGSNVTTKQVVFDIAFGIVMPVFCLLADPILFKGIFGRGIAENFRMFAYSLVGFEILCLVAWLVAGRRSAILSATLSAAMMMGALFALAIGIVLIPFSIIGIFFVIGVFGFSPWFTAMVFARNALRAYNFAKPQLGKITLAAAIAVGVIVTSTAPLAAHGLQVRAHNKIDRIVEFVSTGNTYMLEKNVKELKKFKMILRETDFDTIVNAYVRENDGYRKHLYSSIYSNFTGRRIEDRVHIFCD